MIELQVDASSVRRALAELSTKELGSALRNSVNDTLRAVQRAERAHIPTAFDLKRASFILNTVKIPREGFATREQLQGYIEIDPSRDILAKFERGGEKVAIGGAKYVVKPARDIRTTGGHVKPSLAFKRFKPFGEASGLRKVQLRGRERTADRRPMLVGQDDTFFLTLSSGLKVLAQRKPRAGFRVLYLLVESVKLPPLLQFETIARAEIDRVWEGYTVLAVSHALRRLGVAG